LIENKELSFKYNFDMFLD